MSIKTLKIKHRNVARDLALGLELKDICELKSLNYSTWRQIASSPIFKAEVNRVASEIEQEAIEEHINDPVVQSLKNNSLKAAKRLGREIDNLDEETGASSNSRISASKEVLNRAGYAAQETEHETNIIFMSLSPDKLQAIKQVKDLEVQPENIMQKVDA